MVFRIWVNVNNTNLQCKKAEIKRAVRWSPLLVTFVPGWPFLADLSAWHSTQVADCYRSASGLYAEGMRKYA